MTLPASTPEATSLRRLTIVDWIGVLLVASSGLFGVAFPLLVAPIFRRVTALLEATPSTLGGVLLRGWVPVLLGLLPLGLLTAALAVPQSLGRRRALLVIAFALTVVEAVVLLIGMYGLLFTAADAAAAGS